MEQQLLLKLLFMHTAGIPSTWKKNSWKLLDKISAEEMGHIKKAHRHDRSSFTIEFFYRNHIFVSALQYSITVFFEILCEEGWTWSSIFFSLIIKHRNLGLEKEVAVLDTVILIQYSLCPFWVQHQYEKLQFGFLRKKITWSKYWKVLKVIKY